MILSDVQSSYDLDRPFQGVGNFETEHQRTLIREVCSAIQTGRLVVVSGLVGAAKTHLLRRIEAELTKARKVSLAKSLAVDKRRTLLPSLIEALLVSEARSYTSVFSVRLCTIGLQTPYIKYLDITFWLLATN
ncbi:hypothetical protein HA45_20355 [Pantoea rodasii]|uniref:hypothetical protein n=1 Tax=Pantoea rodasii TaxID=1076549 RepID=UPI000A22AA1F|nr:hypothetical protein [Pantoea rodasii]ORM61619.1 hypothetical protein HA45_20355 [Pantoea rodasii]